MKIEEAIDRNVELKGELIREGRLEKAEAIELGIEALRFKHKWDLGLVSYNTYPLPGETEE